MQYDEKALIPYRDDDHIELEPMTVLGIHCDCGRSWCLPVQKDFTDWHKVAVEYEERYNRVLCRINEYIKELETEVGDLPSTRRTKALLMQLREMAERMHERDTRERDRLRRSDPEKEQG
jgi:hypothetical protein